jgi:hypothetical protein
LITQGELQPAGNRLIRIAAARIRFCPALLWPHSFYWFNNKKPQSASLYIFPVFIYINTSIAEKEKPLY